MTYFIAILCGLLAGAALGFAAGLGAAELYTHLNGSNSGGSAMSGFFFVGPFGLISGFLLGAGTYLRYAGDSPSLTKGLFWGGGIVFGIGLLVFLIPILQQAGANAGRSTYDLELEFELAGNGEQDLTKFRWGYAGETKEEVADSPFYAQSCPGAVCVLSCRIQMVDSPERRLAMFEHNGKLQKFPIPLPGYVRQATDWSAWQAGEGVRFRWMMRKAK